MLAKMYNHSRIPDEPLRSLLVAAKRAVGCKGAVIVRVTRGGCRVSSEACRCSGLRRWFLQARPRRDAEGRHTARGWVKTDGDYIVLRPPLWGGDLDVVLWRANRLFETMLHEFAHIRDWQVGGKPWSSSRGSGRRPNWGNRPEELRAESTKGEALKKLATHRKKIDDWVLELAIQMLGTVSRA